MNKKNPKVSIIIPCWNAELFIAEAICSCLSQSYENIEIIVVNDGSTDNSQTIIDQFKDRIISVSVANGGANKARNIGFKNSSGTYVFFLDADDYIEGELISSLIDEMMKDDSHIGFGPWVKVKDGVDLFNTRVVDKQDWKSMLIKWLLGEYVPTCSIIWHRSLLNLIEGWDESLKKNQDGDIVMRGLLERPKLSFTNNGRGVYRQHSSIGRVSSASLQNNHLSNSIIYNKILKKSREINDAEIYKSIGYYAYGFASIMYSKNEIHYGNIWHLRAKDMGVENASNSIIGLLLGKFFGLKLKVKIRKTLTKLIDGI